MNEFLFRFLNNFIGNNLFFDNAVWFCAEILIFIAPIFLVFLILLSGNKKLAVKNSLIIFFVAMFAWFFADIIKYIFPTPRPFIVLDSVNLLFQHGDYDSFPSGHTTFLVAFAVMFWFYNRRLGILCLILATVVGLARVVSGVHWPLDIIGGFLLGGGAALFLRSLYVKYFFTRINPTIES